MIRIQDITLPVNHKPQQLTSAVARMLHVAPGEIETLRIARRSIDARKKNRIQWVYSVDVSIPKKEDALLRRGGKIGPTPTYHYEIPSPVQRPVHRPIVVGFGPGGMFAALLLAEAGLCPLVLERGQDAQTRHKLVQEFWKTGTLDPSCNVQFGEGGAGAFSDGKLNTGTHDPRNRWVLEQLVRFGAQEQILYDAKPHVGTDVLLKVIQNLRRRVVELGGEVRFGTKLTGLVEKEGKLSAVTVSANEKEEEIPCDKLILAIGHSARDTFSMLQEAGLPMEPKPFAMGVRIEHLQSQINLSQYGGTPGLPPADYKLFTHLDDGRTVYSFCMCPGGFVVAAASEEQGIVTNGMSYSGRSGTNANAALLVSLQPKDFPYPGPLGGMLWQRELEQKAYALSGSYKAPAQTVGDFLQGVPTTAFGAVTPTYAPGVIPCDLHRILPDCITEPLSQGLRALDQKLHGFANPEAVLTGPETRSSSPVRLLRDENRESNLRGLYPCGEGAGYAGGILSAAADGIRCAESLIASLTVQKEELI